MSNSPNEFDWEMTMRQSDLYANKFMELYEVFGELPQSDDFILEKLQDYELPGMDEMDVEFEIESEAFDPMQMEAPVFFFEKNKSYLLLRQVSIGWCNIFSTLLLPKDRHYGVKILFYLGRALAYYQGAIADGIYKEADSFIASGKRALDALNKAIGMIESLGEMNPKRYSSVTVSMMAHLREIHDHMIDHQTMLRKEKK